MSTKPYQRYFNNKIMKRKNIKISYVGPYVPRECGVATYTKDLVDSIIKQKVEPSIVVVDDMLGNRSYPREVVNLISDDNKDEYKKAAESINNSPADFVHIQHEFGLYGRESGKNILTLVERLKKPFVITYHTILSNPDAEKIDIVKAISSKAKFVISLAQIGSERLNQIYDVPSAKLRHIPHGVPDFEFSKEEIYKKKFGLSGNFVLSTFGLISRNKGLEYAIESVGLAKKNIPNIRYLIIGKTHPHVKEQEGDRYIDELRRLADKNGLSSNVVFINRFLPLEELIDYLMATDIYLTPYLEPEQISSGTLSYAIGAGKVCLSTPYAYASEILSEDQLVPFRDKKILAKKIDYYLANPDQKFLISSKNYQIGQTMSWSRVGRMHYELALEAIEKQAINL